MQKPLLGEKIAVLVANGFNEKDLTVSQKALMNAGADVRVISMDNGLVNSWDENGWGLNFAADQALNQALAVDYTMLMIPGGQRSIDKLKLTAHTKRFLNGFMNARKPVAMFAEAVDLLVFAERAQDMEVSACDAVRASLEEAGANVSKSAYTIFQNAITGNADEESREEFAKAVFDFFVECASMSEAEAA